MIVLLAGFIVFHSFFPDIIFATNSNNPEAYTYQSETNTHVLGDKLKEKELELAKIPKDNRLVISKIQVDAQRHLCFKSRYVAQT